MKQKQSTDKTVFRPFRYLFWAWRLTLIILLLLITISIYELLLRQLAHGSIIIPLILLWLITAYFVLPRIHRFLTKLYLPNYYIGRTRTVDGILGDPINLAIIGSKESLVEIMNRAGWQAADPITFRTSMKIIRSTLLRKSYAGAPVSDLYLFGQVQELAFQREVDGSPSQRHHVRFWRVPDGWFLPGGHSVDWLGAGTYDTKVGLSFFTGQLTHRVAADTDSERDYIIETLKATQLPERIERIEHFNTAYSSRNGGGDKFETDGTMPFIYL